ncbi:MAG: tetratricopeptide repeat protein [Phycisphaerae bacterium]
MMNTSLLRWMRFLVVVLPLALGGCKIPFEVAGHFDDYSEVLKGTGVVGIAGGHYELRGERTGLVARGAGGMNCDRIICDDGRSASYLLFPYGNGMKRARGTLSDGTRFTLYYSSTPGRLAPLLESFRHAADARLGVTRDDAEAAELADMSLLGAMFGNGRGVTKDYAEALKWYRKAAAAGSPSGMNDLGCMYSAGLGVTKDDAEAVRWYRKAAEAGDAAGMYNLGVMYEDGEGVAKNLTEALKWYRKAAALGNDYSKKALKRLGVPE